MRVRIGLALLLGALASTGCGDGVPMTSEMEPFEDNGPPDATILPPRLPTLPPDVAEQDATIPTSQSSSDSGAPAVPIDADAGGAPDAAQPASDAGVDAGPRIELSELRVNGTPTGSLRMGAWGYDPQHGLCIMAVWYFHDIAETSFCAHQPELGVPYVVIQAMDDPMIGDPKWEHTDPPCWAYSGNVTLLEQRGCADFGNLSDPAQYAIDAEIDVASDAFTGTIHLLH